MKHRLKAACKRALFDSGAKSRRVRTGLLAGLSWCSDPAIDIQQLTGLYEREIAGSIRRFAVRARSAVDAGANNGYYTLFFASCESISQVISCEPDPVQIRFLQQNLAINPPPIMKKVQVQAAALGCGEGCLSIDKVLSELPEPILLKMDVEGSEMDVLRSGLRSLGAKRLLLVIETHSLDLENACIQLLERYQYRCAIRKQGWYRVFAPEQRSIPHNRWLIAERL